MSEGELADPSSGSPETPRTRMTIGDAKRVFQEYGPELQHDFEGLVQLFRAHGIALPISNSNYLHALSMTDLMFRHTDRSLRMVTGNATEGLPQCLQTTFRRMLQRIRGNGGKARMVVIDSDTAALEPLRQEFSGTFELARARPRQRARVTHFIVCDDDMVRDEQYHDTLGDDTDANTIKAHVYFANPEMASTFGANFDAIWDAVRPSA